MGSALFPIEGTTYFEGLTALFELFPSPITQSIKSDPEYDVETIRDLVFCSSRFGFRELFLSHDDSITVVSGDTSRLLKTTDFIRWQLERMPSETLYILISKVGANVSDILDVDAEMENNDEYDPDSWLNPYQSEFQSLGIQFIDRLRSERSDEFFTAIVDAVVSPHTGILNWLETEIDDELSCFEDYDHWETPLGIVTIGSFRPYLENSEDEGLMMDEYRIEEAYVRNYDEGDKGGG
jgi:hypothetical protein